MAFNTLNKNESEDAYIIPNPIDNPVFDVNTDEKDYSERIYLDKNKMIKNKDKLSSIFKTIEIINLKLWIWCI